MKLKSDAEVSTGGKLSAEVVKEMAASEPVQK
jgi:hypothetical protein